jgi:hypothetical protein
MRPRDTVRVPKGTGLLNAAEPSSPSSTLAQNIGIPYGLVSDL